MTASPIRSLLLIEDNAIEARLLREMFRQQEGPDLNLTHVESMLEAERHLAAHPVDVILLDLELPDARGLEAVRRTHAAAPRIPLVVLTQHGDEALAVAALREGAQEYFVKGGIELRGLPRALRYAVERKALEARLSQSEEQYRLLFDSNPHPLWVFDAQTLGFLAVNNAAVRLYGYSREEFLGMTIEAIRPPAEIPALRAHVATMGAEPSQVATQVKHRRKDGSLLEVAGAANPLEFEGRRAYLVMATDVTEQRALEAQLLQAQRMEAVGRLAGGVAHDFNNLLGVITGYSELLLQDLGADHAGTRRVEQIQKAADSAAGLTRQLLAFSRRQLLQPRLLDLDEVVSDVEKMLREVIGKDIELVTHRGPDLGLILADPDQIGQVLMNLVGNARDAMPKGGKLVLETANVVLDEAYALAHPEVQPGSFVMLSMSDTGVGMDSHTQVQVFEPFFTTKALGKGTGLGLATVIGIIQQSGGSVSVESTLGMGTTFRIYLPRAEGSLPRSSPLTVDLPSSTGSATILLVDDTGALRMLVREVLEGAGYNVLECSGPLEALARVDTWSAPIDLLLTDVVMPIMSGPVLAQDLRQTRPELRVLLMSGYAARAMGEQSTVAEGTRFLQKPFSPTELLRSVRAALEEPFAAATSRVSLMPSAGAAPG